MTLVSRSCTVLLLGRSMAVRHARPILILALLFCSVSTSLGSSGEPISVSEAKIAFHLFPETRVEVPVFNHGNQVVRASLTLELLGDDSNRMMARHERAFAAAPGSHTVTLGWDLNELTTKSLRALGAYLLRDTLT